MSWDAFFETVNSLWVVWLMLIFLGIVFWAFRPKNKARFEADAHIPFRDEQDQ